MMPYRLRLIILAIIASLASLSAAARAASPDSGAAESRVQVVTDGFSSWIALPGKDGRLDVYAFAQTDWYLRGEQSIFGMISTLGSGEAVVQRGRLRNLPTGDHDTPVVWTIPVDSSQASTLRKFLEGSYDATRRYVYHPDSTHIKGGWWIEPVRQPSLHRQGWRFHPTDLRYSVWWNCHDYILRALRKADLIGRGTLRIVLTADRLAGILTKRHGPPEPVSQQRSP
jgi:hypothetical protein